MRLMIADGFRSHSRWRNEPDKTPFAQGTMRQRGWRPRVADFCAIDYRFQRNGLYRQRASLPEAVSSQIWPGGLMRPDYRGGPRAGNEVAVTSFQDATTISRKQPHMTAGRRVDQSCKLRRCLMLAAFSTVREARRGI